jgi:hypothetical protein
MRYLLPLSLRTDLPCQRMRTTPVNPWILREDS